MRIRRPKIAFAGGGLTSVVVLIAMTQPFGSGCSDTAQAAVGAPTPPPKGGMSAAQLVAYFEHDHWSPNASGGIVGNMSQESSLNPGTAGGGLVQNIGTMWTTQVTYDQQHNLDPNSYAGQLEFLVWYVPRQSWWSQFNGAKTPEDAALWFQNNYELCSGHGAVGTDQQGGGLCNPSNRMAQAAAALKAAGGAGGAIPVDLSTSGSCAQAASVMVGGATNPAPGATWSRLDMGFDGDYNMNKGAVAPYNGTVHIPGEGGWPGQGVYFYIVNDNQSGPDYTRAMYFAEGATPMVKDGTHVTAGTQIGKPVASGGDGAPGNFEIGPAQVQGGDCLAKKYILGSAGARQMILAFYHWMLTLGAGKNPGSGPSNPYSSPGNT